VIGIGFSQEYLGQFFGSVTETARVNPKYALPEERNLAVFVCRDPKMSMAEAWPRLRYLN
jgi:hypothetical protein